jgi:hypothetical protein
MRKVLILLGVIAFLLAVGAGVLLWLLQDPNRFKPQLEELIADGAGFEVKLRGDLAWELWPPVVLSAEDIAFEDELTAYSLERLGLKLDVLALLRSRGELQVERVTLDNLRLVGKALGDVTHVHKLQLSDFAPGQPSPLSVDATLEAPDTPPANVTMQALLTYDQEGDAARLSDMRFDYDGIEGTCDIAVSHLSREPIFAHEGTPDDVLPLDTFRSLDWMADCVVPSLLLGDFKVENVAVHSENTSAVTQNTLEIPKLFGGSLRLDAGIDSREQNPEWSVKAGGKDLQSQQIADQLSPSLIWAAPLALDGKFALRGNTVPALLGSLKGTMKLDAGSGELGIGMLKEVALELARLAGKPEQVASWPDVLSYGDLGGDWTIAGTRHSGKFALDNIRIAADGDLDLLTEAMDMAASLTIDDDPNNALEVPEELYGVPIPLRCGGTLSVPECGLDSDRAQQVAQEILTRKAQERGREEIDKALEENIPEGDAKKLLDGFFGKKKR